MVIVGKGTTLGSHNLLPLMKPPPRPHIDAGKPTINPSVRSTKKREIVSIAMLKPRV